MFHPNRPPISQSLREREALANSEAPLSSAEDKLYSALKSKRPVDNDKKEIKELEKFSDIYPPEEIRKDQIKLGQAQETADSVHTMRSKLAEYIYSGIANEYKWFGDSSVINETSEFDDRFNHTDLVLEWDLGEGREPAALAIDVTAAQDVRTVDRKEYSIEQDLQYGKVTRLKYFQSAIDPQNRGSVYMPRVVLSVSFESINRLADFYENDKESLANPLEMKVAWLLIVQKLYDQMKILAENMEYRIKGSKNKSFGISFFIAFTNRLRKFVLSHEGKENIPEDFLEFISDPEYYGFIKNATRDLSTDSHFKDLANSMFAVLKALTACAKEYKNKKDQFSEKPEMVPGTA